MSAGPDNGGGGSPGSGGPDDAARQKLVLKLVIAGCLLANLVVLAIVLFGRERH